LRTLGYEVTSVSVDTHGRIDPDEVTKAMRDDTILVSITHASNEIGTIQPIEEISKITQERKVVFHCDAVASVGVVPIDVQALGVDLLSLAANQFHGPSGVGGLYIRRGTSLWPLLDGGFQEKKRRGGTENLVGIIGMGVAAELAQKEMESRMTHANGIKTKLTKGLKEKIDEIIFNGDPENALPNLVSVSIKYIEGESIVLMLDDEKIAVSTKSACASGALRASHVLVAIGRDYADAQGTLVVTFGQGTSEEEINTFLDELAKAVGTLRSMSPLYKNTG
jgi:cysteine desulfurase